MEKLRIDVEKSGAVAIDDLTGFQGGLKELSDESYTKLKNEMLDLGFSEPVTVWRNKNKNYLLNGHQRCTALMRMRDEGVSIPKIPVTFVKAKSIKEAKRKVLALTSQFGEMSKSSLYDFMKDANLNLTDIVDFQFPEVDITKFGAQFFPEPGKPGLTDDDKVPTIEKGKKVRLGEIWTLGQHRVMCGDATDDSLITDLLAGTSIDLVYTDPPYGVSVVKDGKVGADFGVAKKGEYKAISGDGTVDVARNAYLSCIAAGPSQFILWGGNYFTEFLKPSNSWIVWNKRGDTGIKNTFADGELAWTNLGHPVRIYSQLWNGMIREGEKEKRVHPTQKPVALAEWCFTNYGEPKTVLDLFGGSGSTLIACEKTSRKCFIMEIDPHYCSVIIQRFCDFSGKEAYRENPDGSKTSWSETKNSNKNSKISVGRNK